MKKTLAIILALLMLLTLFAGCGDKTPASNPGTSAPADKPADTPADKPEDKPEDKPADDGKVYELIFSMHDAETAITSEYIKAWAKTVEEASNGRIKFILLLRRYCKRNGRHGRCYQRLLRSGLEFSPAVPRTLCCFHRRRTAYARLPQQC